MGRQRSRQIADWVPNISPTYLSAAARGIVGRQDLRLLMYCNCTTFVKLEMLANRLRTAIGRERESRY